MREAADALRTYLGACDGRPFAHRHLAGLERNHPQSFDLLRFATCITLCHSLIVETAPPPEANASSSKGETVTVDMSPMPGGASDGSITVYQGPSPDEVLYF